ncbi:MAG: molybdopterin cofactor-binding domain-containing protein [Pseudomonadales bacterium]|jgi:CO/xanthine dehydrogenase Mo-binding subunit|nr:molybdopterin cofactor-binding domain-containing protein [Pseudomonadales bacterium]
MRKFAQFDPSAVASHPPAPAPSGFSRRGFLVGSLGGSLVMAFAAAGCAPKPETGAATRTLEAGSWEPTLYYRIDPDGQITVNVTEAEMGQHVGTALARIVAEELEADWSRVSLHYVDSDPKWGLMVTGGSWSVWQNFDLLSRAGAAGRMALLEAGARMLDVPVASVTARNGRIVAGDRALGYGEIVAAGAVDRVYTAEEMDALPIKPPSARRLIGEPVAALDVPAKSRGTAVYGIDAEIEGMVYGRPLVPPTRLGSTVKSVDDSGAKSVPGYLKTLVLDDPSGTVPGWAVVLADSYHAALAASEKVSVDWEAGETAAVSEEDILARGFALIDAPEGGAMVRDDEGVDAAFGKAARVLEADYTTATALHFQLEPVNALAVQRDGVWEIHTGNQWQSLILPTLATALGVPEETIVLKTYLLGGGFGRRLNGDYTVPAALAAKAHGGPVKLVFTREDDARFDSVRSASAQRVRMALGENGEVLAMEHHAAAGWPTQVMVPAFMPDGVNGEKYDPFSISGADHWYSVGPHRVRALSNDLANRTFRPGWLRYVGPGWTNWALESFIDEAAHATGRDPVAFRLDMLRAEGRNAGEAPNSVGGAARQAEVLRRLAERAGLGETLPADTGIGVATTFGQERGMPTWSACAARVKVDRETGAVKLEKLTLVIDAGTIVDPDGALAQAEGAALWGASLALHEGTRFEQGQVAARNLDRYTPMRMADVPELDIVLVDSDETPVGMGEPATTVVGPAIGNALFAAVGARVRHIPIQPQTVLDALQA